MRIAAYQAPLLALGSMEGLKLIGEQVRACESIGVEILCCPEAVLGGLADYIRRPSDIAIDVSSGRLQSVLSPISSPTVTTIVGFTESCRNGGLFNSAAVFCKGEVIGVYRKLHPAINRSVYEPGTATSIFRVGGLIFGVVICRDSTYPAPAQIMASQGATVLFVPTNNALAPAKAGVEAVEQARHTDIRRAREHRIGHPGRRRRTGRRIVVLRIVWNGRPGRHCPAGCQTTGAGPPYSGCSGQFGSCRQESV